MDKAAIVIWKMWKSAFLITFFLFLKEEVQESK